MNVAFAMGPMLLARDDQGYGIKCRFLILLN